jgi:23S rRNA (adenine2503-C2)-methyltransferase
MISETRINLLDLSLDELTQLLVGWGQPRFRATQLWRWVYHSLTANPDEMVNLPRELRTRLAEETTVGRLSVVDAVSDDDGLTEKLAMATADGQVIEVVLMRYTSRNTVCVSSQIGCALGCLFCATGQQGLVRDLSAGEMAAQVLHYAQKLRETNALVTNVVVMGMGEPMLNFDAVWKAIQNLNDREGLALGMRRFTISTVGVVPGIERMAREGSEVGLSVSLHAPDNALRDQLVPINRRYPLERLLPACRLYTERTGRRVTFEYALMNGVNDSERHAAQTARLLQGLLCHINLIPVNPVAGCAYEPSSRERVLRFQEVLVKHKLQTTVRLRRGVGIEAGCGQLRGRVLAS